MYNKAIRRSLSNGYPEKELVGILTESAKKEDFGLKFFIMTSWVQMSNETKYLISRTKKAILLLHDSEMYVKKWGAESYVKELGLIREDIDFIAIGYPEEAKILMLDFIDTSYSIFYRIKDKDSVIEDFFQKCVEDLVGIFAKLPFDIQEIVEVVYTIICMYPDNSNAPFGHFFNNHAVFSFKNFLSRDDGLYRLKDKLIELLNSPEKKKYDFLYCINATLKEIAFYTENGISSEYSRS
jgi:hypothetical protein